jgi:hypothetical protein
MNRKPIYDKEHKLRAISVPNGLWQVQSRRADKGTRERDCWGNELRRPCSLNEAKMALGVVL